MSHSPADLRCRHCLRGIRLKNRMLGGAIWSTLFKQGDSVVCMSSPTQHHRPDFSRERLEAWLTA